MTEQDQIRAAYERYRSTARHRLWDASNRGYARLSRDRDVVVAGLLRASLPARGGRIIDVGCGSGHAVSLVPPMPDVAYTGLDLLPDRIEKAQSANPDARFVLASADAMPFADGSFDVALALTLFSSLPSPALEERVAREIERVLRPRGWLIWYDLRYGNPTNSAVHRLSHGRLRELFQGWEVDVRTFSLAPPLARRLGRLTPVAYPLLHSIPLLRSHLVGRLRCPA